MSDGSAIHYHQSPLESSEPVATEDLDESVTQPVVSKEVMRAKARRKKDINDFF